MKKGDGTHEFAEMLTPTSERQNANPANTLHSEKMTVSTGRRFVRGEVERTVRPWNQNSVSNSQGRTPSLPRVVEQHSHMHTIRIVLFTIRNRANYGIPVEESAYCADDGNRPANWDDQYLPISRTNRPKYFRISDEENVVKSAETMNAL